MYHIFLIKENEIIGIPEVTRLRKRNLTPFGRLVNEQLVKLNMTQKKLAEKVGTSEVYLSMILRGERSGQKYLDKIMKVLDINKNDITRNIK